MSWSYDLAQVLLRSIYSSAYVQSLSFIPRENEMMNARYADRPAVGIYDGPPTSPQFVSCQRLPTPPPPQPPRRSLWEVFEDIVYYFSIVCMVVLVLELLLQVVMYAYLQTPGGRSAAAGQTRTHYDILGVDPGADQDAITSGWRLQSIIFHPETTEDGNTEETRERYYWIQLAYVELSDPLARCYHDQYHRILPRKWGGDDPCTKILKEREKETRGSTGDASDPEKTEMLRKLEKDYGVSLNWLKATKKKRDEREWKNAGGWKQKYLAIREALEDFGKQFIAWQYVAMGFILAMIERYWGYLAEFEKKHFHEVRRRFHQIAEELVKIWEWYSGQ